MNISVTALTKSRVIDMENGINAEAAKIRKAIDAIPDIHLVAANFETIDKGILNLAESIQKLGKETVDNDCPF